MGTTMEKSTLVAWDASCEGRIKERWAVVTRWVRWIWWGFNAMQQSGLVFFLYLVGTYHDDSVGVDYLDGHVVILVHGTGQQKRGVKEGSGSC